MSKRELTDEEIIEALRQVKETFDTMTTLFERLVEQNAHTVDVIRRLVDLHTKAKEGKP